ncbi:60S ribosomal protein L7-2, putative [Plasmodium gallinaceum]|uniref:60S ribosomal protein L7-2, putative n=1 Tax=Plasmodium gallinaceum TaxID=5849 RepID=A0A1J1GNP2_PLAGA|nr:60S ribosomal protein L7-2, putative [Plasmodium gallinaceum]CRG93902.1 60S ribosomal protein L7-2, putative [Plasmodium gallinaceum]
MNKSEITKEPKNKIGNNKIKRVKFRRVKKIKFKDEKILVEKRKSKVKKNKSKKKFDTIFKKKEYEKKLEKQKDEFYNLQKQWKNQNFDQEKSCIFVLRNDVDCIYNAPKKILQKLKLNNKYDGILLINTKKNMKILFIISPYICYGYIKKYNFYNLMEKRLFLKDDNNKIKRVNSNKIIEELFGKQGILSFSSLCDYIFECKENADLITKKYIMPFDFSFLNNKMTFDFLQFKNEFKGFMKEEINEILEKII